MIRGILRTSFALARALAAGQKAFTNELTLFQTADRLHRERCESLRRMSDRELLDLTYTWCDASAARELQRRNVHIPGSPGNS